jgi:hypothetical protein
LHALIGTTLVLVAGCGGTTDSRLLVSPNPPAIIGTPPPTSPTQNPAPTPTPTPSPPTTPTTGPAPTPPTIGQWSATVSSASNPNVGFVTVGTGGDITIQLNAAPASTAFDVQFCQFPSSSFDAQGLNACLPIATLTTSASGAVQTTIAFPQSGVWSGHFFFNTGVQQATDSLSTEPAALTGTFMAQLVPMSTANNDIMADMVNIQDQLAAGSVTASGGQFTITVSGTAANAVFNVAECSTVGSTECQNIATFTTDAGGSGSANAAATASGGSIFRLQQASKTGGGFVSGFTVP